MIKIESELTYARIALDVAQSDLELQGQLALYGYGPERLQQGSALYQEVLGRIGEYADARQVKVSATQAFYAAWRAARRRYTRDLETMRVVLSDQPDQSFYLQLAGKRDTTFAGWHGQALRLYEGIQKSPTLQALLAPEGITLDRVAEALQALEGVVLARVVQSDKEGLARAAFTRRNEARQKLNAWIELFGTSARQALADRPDDLVRLGLHTTLEQERRRLYLLKKEREEKAKKEAEAKAAQAATQSQAAASTAPGQADQLIAALSQAQQAVAIASALVAAASE